MQMDGMIISLLEPLKIELDDEAAIIKSGLFTGIDFFLAV